jgi:DNA-binding HxlR family transcriptional regulator
MKKLTNLSKCPVEISLQLMGDRWKVLIIKELLNGTKRFGELKRAVTGISQKVLTQHLRAMEGRGLLVRKIYPQIPPKVEYTLTDLGHGLKAIIDQMHECGENYQRHQNTNKKNTTN